MTGPRLSLPPPPARSGRKQAARGVARGLATDFLGRPIDDTGAAGQSGQPTDAQQPAPAQAPADQAATPTVKRQATETIGARAGSLSDELDFPEFVASLVHGTFDAIVDASIRQMDAMADLVAAIAKPLDQFTNDNVTANQARDFLTQTHPSDLALVNHKGSFKAVPRGADGKPAKPTSDGDGSDGGDFGDGDEEPKSPDWLGDYGLAGEELTPELVEERLVPAARERVARNRLQTLATMVMLGMNRVVVKDGSISARLQFRASAADTSKVDYAVSDDPSTGDSEWGRRGSRMYAAPSTKVSTVGVNAQTDSELKAALFGEVKINFASETVPLDRFADDARRVLLERHARPAATQPRLGGAASQATAPAPAVAIATPPPPPAAAATPPSPPAPIPTAPPPAATAPGANP